MERVTEKILSVGVEDDNLDLFEGQYPLTEGISYNSYFIDAEEAAVVDAVDTRRTEEWLDNVAAAVESTGREPSWLIVQHVEPDHSGSIVELARRYPSMRIKATQRAIAMLANFFEDFDFHGVADAVGDGDTLDLGGTVLTFVTAPMVHWPEVMVTLESRDGVLFSADAFGSFAMAAGGGPWDNEARRYYANIVGRFGNSVQTLLGKLKGKPFGVIAPLHGPVLRENLAHYWQLYDKWSRWEPETRGVLVAYASIYGGTAVAARRLAGMLEREGAGEVVTLDLSRHDVSVAIAEAFRLSGLVLCSVTYDGDMFPAMRDFLHHLGRKNIRGRRVGIVENGSWAPQAGRLMAAMVEEMKEMEIVEPRVTLHSRMHHTDAGPLGELARSMGADGQADKD